MAPTFIDLGLPSGILWAAENENDNYRTRFFNYNEKTTKYKGMLPSQENWNELENSCKWTWDDKREGLNVTGPNGNSIFLPADGVKKDYQYAFGGIGCYLWTSGVNFIGYHRYQGYDGYFINPDTEGKTYYASVRLCKTK